MEDLYGPGGTDGSRGRHLMGPQNPPVGTCPECGEDIPSHRVLIEYETEDGPDMFAECMGCGEVVHPVQ